MPETRKPIPVDLSPFKDDGMLAELPEGFCAFVQQAFGHELACMRTINRRIVSALWGLRANTAVEKHAAILLAKLAQSFQACVLLIERAMPVESHALGRLTLECAIELSAVAADPSRVGEIEAAGRRHDRLYAERMIAHLKERGWWEPGSGVARMYEEAVKADGASARLEDAARRGGTLLLYDVFYRGASGTAAHATQGALLQQIEVDGDQVSIKVGPNFEDIPLAFVLVCTAALNGILFASQIFDDSELAAATEQVTAEFNRIIAAYPAQAD
jgi:hypothetical protein